MDNTNKTTAVVSTAKPSNGCIPNIQTTVNNTQKKTIKEAIMFPIKMEVITNTAARHNPTFRINSSLTKP